MALSKQYCVYIMTNTHHTVLYTGVTNNLARRVYEHKNGLGSAFVKKYNVHKLVYYEIGNDAHATMVREKQIKGSSRKKKIELINRLNPEWKDLYEEIK
jgi:putative endonuclease